MKREFEVFGLASRSSGFWFGLIERGRKMDLQANQMIKTWFNLDDFGFKKNVVDFTFNLHSRNLKMISGNIDVFRNQN